MLAATALVTIPILTIDLVIFAAIKHNTYKQVTKYLVTTNEDWQHIAQSYDQQARENHRSQMLRINQQLEAQIQYLQATLEMTSVDKKKPAAILKQVLHAVRAEQQSHVVFIDAQERVYTKNNLEDAQDQTLLDFLGADQIQTLQAMLPQVRELWYGQTLSVKLKGLMTERSDHADHQRQSEPFEVSVGYFEALDLVIMCYESVEQYTLEKILEQYKQQYVVALSAKKLDQSEHICIFDQDYKQVIRREKDIDSKKPDQHKLEQSEFKAWVQKFQYDDSGHAQVERISRLDIEDHSYGPQLLTISKIGHWNWVLVVSQSIGDIERDVKQIQIEVVGLGLLAIGLGVLGAFIMAKRMAAPIEKLSQAAKQVSWGAYSIDLSDLAGREDEIGELAISFRDMALGLKNQISLLENSQLQLQNQNGHLQHEMTQREEIQQQKDQLSEQLITASREAGMAEIATAVLHNIGNVLNSVNVSTAMLTESMEHSPVHNFLRITELIREHQDDLSSYIKEDPQGKHLPEALLQIANTFEHNHQTVEQEVKQLLNNVDHIKHIIHAQQSYVTHAGISQSSDPMQMFNDALTIHEAGIKQRSIAIHKDFDEMSEVKVDRYKVLQILVNLIGNAKHAMESVDHRSLSLHLNLQEADQKKWLVFKVVDTGCGIAAENLTRIFTPNFSTHEQGRGFGLHHSILAAKELGGDLIVQSSGLGQGATFELRIPVMQEQPIFCDV